MTVNGKSSFESWLETTSTTAITFNLTIIVACSLWYWYCYYCYRNVLFSVFKFVGIRFYCIERNCYLKRHARQNNRVLRMVRRAIQSHSFTALSTLSAAFDTVQMNAIQKPKSNWTKQANINEMQNDATENGSLNLKHAIRINKTFTQNILLQNEYNKHKQNGKILSPMTMVISTHNVYQWFNWVPAIHKWYLTVIDLYKD